MQSITDTILYDTVNAHLSVGAVINRSVFGRARSLAPDFERIVTRKLRAAEEAGIVRAIPNCCNSGTVHWVLVEDAE
jgi:hypothetical protein